MDALRFDHLSKVLAHRRRARHNLAQEATPTVAPPSQAPELLFVQSFQAGAIAPKEGTEGRYTLTLEGGHGQTLYFSDRPDRIVGAGPTQRVLDRIGFPDDDPPNAALVVETASGETDVAVVELFAPVVDEGTGGVTYEVAVLANWQAELGVGLPEAPIDLAALEPSFGAAHLFIDSLHECPHGPVRCLYTEPGSDEILYEEIPEAEFGGRCTTFGRFSGGSGQDYCLPCSTLGGSGTPDDQWAQADLQWTQICNERFPQQCYPFCEAYDVCFHDRADMNPCVQVPS